MMKLKKKLILLLFLPSVFSLIFPGNLCAAAASAVPYQNTKAQTRYIRRTQSDIQMELYRYLMVSQNREKVKKKVRTLNRGHYHNACVYFTSESLRNVGVNLPNYVNHTGRVRNDKLRNRSLTSNLLSRGWKIERDMTKLLPGDICFTTNSGFGAPTHAYIFMGWVKPGSYDYAYICDNHVYDYGSTYHKRNIRISIPGKEAFSYFMYKPVK